jgi:hypothetical protein
MGVPIEYSFSRDETIGGFHNGPARALRGIRRSTRPPPEASVTLVVACQARPHPRRAECVRRSRYRRACGSSRRTA